MQDHPPPAVETKVGSASKPPCPIAEIVTFRLLPEMTDAIFLARVRESADLVASQPGFLNRHLSRDENGVWTDMVTWASLPTAMAAAQTVMADPLFGPLMAAIDPVGVSLRHAPILWSMSG